MQFVTNFYDTLPTTMDCLNQMIDEGAEEGTIVWTTHQTGGRGRHGQSWECAKGNLAFSLLLTPEKEMVHIPQLSFVLALSLVKVLEAYDVANDLIQVKWPNDILVEGKKISGILVENYKDKYNVGIGLNIISSPALENTYETTYLSRYTNVTLDAEKVLDLFKGFFKVFYKQWHKEGFEPIKNEWLKKAYRLNKEIKIKMNTRELTGIFKDLMNDGRLLLKEGSGDIHYISAGYFYN